MLEVLIFCDQRRNYIKYAQYLVLRSVIVVDIFLKVSTDIFLFWICVDFLGIYFAIVFVTSRTSLLLSAGVVWQ